MRQVGRRAVRKRFVLVVIAGIVAIPLPGTAALAASSAHVVEHHVALTCVPITGPGAAGYFTPSHNSVSGSEPGLELWLEPDDIASDPPTLVATAGELVVGSGDSTLTGTMELASSASGDPAGTATFSASLTPTGSAEFVEWPKSASNRKHRESQVIQPMAVTGELTVSVGILELVFPLEGCVGSASDFVTFSNDPTSTVSWAGWTTISCDFFGEDLQISLRARNEAGLVATDFVVTRPGNSFLTADDGTHTHLSRTDYGVALELVPSGGHGVTTSAGVITAEATLAARRKTLEVEEVDGSRVRITVQPYTVLGSVTLSLHDGTAASFEMDATTCSAAEVSVRVMTAP